MRTEDQTEKLGNYTEGKGGPMSSIAEASNLLRQIAEPRPVGDTIKAAINRAANRVSKFLHAPMKPSRAEDIWRREARTIKAEEMDAIREAAAARIVGEAKRERTELEARIARLEALLFQDEEFHRPSVDALRELGRREDRTVD